MMSLRPKSGRSLCLKSFANDLQKTSCPKFPEILDIWSKKKVLFKSCNFEEMTDFEKNMKKISTAADGFWFFSKIFAKKVHIVMTDNPKQYILSRYVKLMEIHGEFEPNWLEKVTMSDHNSGQQIIVCPDPWGQVTILLNPELSDLKQNLNQILDWFPELTSILLTVKNGLKIVGKMDDKWTKIVTQIDIKEAFKSSTKILNDFNSDNLTIIKMNSGQISSFKKGFQFPPNLQILEIKQNFKTENFKSLLWRDFKKPNQVLSRSLNVYKGPIPANLDILNTAFPGRVSIFQKISLN
jgi:hypothetical protein